MTVFYSLDHTFSFQGTFTRFTMGVIKKNQKNGYQYYHENRTTHG